MSTTYYNIILYCSGVHHEYPMGTLRIIVNLSAVLCAMVLILLNVCKEKKLQGIESLSLLFVVSTKYLTLVFGRELIKKLVKSMQNFWEVDITDDQTKFFKQHLNRVDKFHKILTFTGILAYATKPFTQNDKTSIFNCYIPPEIPYPLYFTFECYLLVFVSSTFVSFNVLICTLIISVVTQFRLLNWKIKTINFPGIENKRDLDTCLRKLKNRIKYHQFLIAYVQDLNKLLSTPIAMLIVFSVSLMCMDMYVLSSKESSIVIQCKILVTGFSIIAEYFSVYGFPAQLMMDESAATADTIYYECNWYLPKVLPLRQYFLMIIMRSQKDVCIRAGDYHVVSNETILRMLKTAYSFYTVLQTIREE